MHLERTADQCGAIHYEMEPAPLRSLVEDGLDGIGLVGSASLIHDAVEDDASLARHNLAVLTACTGGKDHRL